MRTWHKRAAGNIRPSMPCFRRIVIALDDETFDVIATIAFQREHSFAAVAREIIEIGMETMGNGQPALNMGGDKL